MKKTAYSIFVLAAIVFASSALALLESPNPETAFSASGQELGSCGVQSMQDGTHLDINHSGSNIILAKSSKTVLHGNVKSGIFHGPGCRYYNCKNCTVVFMGREEAINAGYRPCKICKP